MTPNDVSPPVPTEPTRDFRPPTAEPPGGTGTLPDRSLSAASPDQDVASSAALRVGNYEVLEELGRGGMGVVYRARHVTLKHEVALKMILAGGQADQAELARFHLEAAAVARLHHQGIVHIHEFGTRDGMPFFSLELLNGGSLAQQLKKGPLPVREAAALLEKLARAMQHAHENGIVHRDLKPANVLLTNEGEPKRGADGHGHQLRADDRGLGRDLHGVQPQRPRPQRQFHLPGRLDG